MEEAPDVWNFWKTSYPEFFFALYPTLEYRTPFVLHDNLMESYTAFSPQFTKVDLRVPQITVDTIDKNNIDLDLRERPANKVRINTVGVEQQNIFKWGYPNAGTGFGRPRTGTVDGKITSDMVTAVYPVSWSYPIHRDRIYGKPDWTTQERLIINVRAGNDVRTIDGTEFVGLPRRTGAVEIMPDPVHGEGNTTPWTPDKNKIALPPYREEMWDVYMTVFKDPLERKDTMGNKNLPFFEETFKPIPQNHN